MGFATAAMEHISEFIFQSHLMDIKLEISKLAAWA